MKTLILPYNVETKIDGRPTISWDKFKTIITKRYNYIYDSDAKCFYMLQEGSRRYMSSMQVEILASLYGHYDNMEDYIDVR